MPRPTPTPSPLPTSIRPTPAPTPLPSLSPTAGTAQVSSATVTDLCASAACGLAFSFPLDAGAVARRTGLFLSVDSCQGDLNHVNEFLTVRVNDLLLATCLAQDLHCDDPSNGFLSDTEICCYPLTCLDHADISGLVSAAATAVVRRKCKTTEAGCESLPSPMQLLPCYSSLVRLFSTPAPKAVTVTGSTQVNDVDCSNDDPDGQRYMLRCNAFITVASLLTPAPTPHPTAPSVRPTLAPTPGPTALLAVTAPATGATLLCGAGAGGASVVAVAWATAENGVGGTCPEVSVYMYKGGAYKATGGTQLPNGHEGSFDWALTAAQEALLCGEVNLRVVVRCVGGSGGVSDHSSGTFALAGHPTALPTPPPTERTTVGLHVLLTLSAASEGDVTADTVLSALAGKLAGVDPTAPGAVRSFAVSFAARRLLPLLRPSRRLITAAVSFELVVSDPAALGFASAGDLIAAVTASLRTAAADGSLTEALSASCGCVLATSGGTGVDIAPTRPFPTLEPTPAPRSSHSSGSGGDGAFESTVKAAGLGLGALVLVLACGGVVLWRRQVARSKARRQEVIDGGEAVEAAVGAASSTNRSSLDFVGVTGEVELGQLTSVARRPPSSVATLEAAGISAAMMPMAAEEDDDAMTFDEVLWLDNANDEGDDDALSGEDAAAKKQAKGKALDYGERVGERVVGEKVAEAVERARFQAVVAAGRGKDADRGVGKCVGKDFGKDGKSSPPDSPSGKGDGKVDDGKGRSMLDEDKQRSALATGGAASFGDGDAIALLDVHVIDYAALKLERRPFAHGGGGQVFRGKYLGYAVAAKQVFMDVARADFEREVALLTKLSHPAITVLYGMSESPDGGLIMVMEFCGGGDLRCYYPTDDFSAAAEYARVAVELLSGVAYLHKRGVAHRDLKPENVLLSAAPELRVKLADFGLAKKSRGTVTRGVGTPAYMPPEMFDDSEDPEKINMLAVDVYALGVILWELWFQVPPYGSKSIHQILALVLRNQRPPLAADALERQGVASKRKEPLPAPLAAGIERCWAEAAANRPTMAQVAEAFVEQIRPLLVPPADEEDQEEDEEDDNDFGSGKAVGKAIEAEGSWLTMSGMTSSWLGSDLEGSYDAYGVGRGGGGCGGGGGGGGVVNACATRTVPLGKLVVAEAAEDLDAAGGKGGKGGAEDVAVAIAGAVAADAVTADAVAVEALPAQSEAVLVQSEQGCGRASPKRSAKSSKHPPRVPLEYSSEKGKGTKPAEDGELFTL